MSKRFIAGWLIASLFVLTGGVVNAGGNYGEAAPDFPPGAFNDGQHYQLSDYEGKVVVLFFYEKDCPTCRGLIPQRNAVVNAYKGKPVKFIAVAAGDTLQQAKQYVGSTKLAMPVFADSLSLMERRYGQTISLQNIYQFRVVGPDGKVTGYKMEADDIDKALAKVELKYKPDDYHAKLRPAVDLFEWNQYPAGMKTLRPLLKNSDKEVADSANKLLATITEDGNKWLAEADGDVDSDPVKAYDLYNKVAAAFGPTDDLGKKSAEGLKKLKTNDALKKELDARKMYDKMLNGMAMATAKQKTELATFAGSIVKKYPDTPTAKKAEALQKELGG